MKFAVHGLCLEVLAFFFNSDLNKKYMSQSGALLSQYVLGGNLR